MKVDLVYLWVDGNDPEWRKKKESYLTDIKKYDNDAVNVSRFANNDELKYSLRSVEQFAPWINRIFIVTDNQIPHWLNTDNPKVTIVDHKEIFPADKLPLFNSNAIEAKISEIPGLSEYFLYANDDMFFWGTVDKEFFFEGEKVICRFDKKLKREQYNKGLYGSSIRRAYNLVKDRYNLPMDAHYPHHNIDAYRKSIFYSCEEEYKKDFDKTLNNRFREFDDIQRSIVSFYAVATGAGVPKFVHCSWIDKHIFRKKYDSMYSSVSSKKLDKILNCEAKLMCLNDYRKTTNSDRSKLKEVLEKKFPNKSEFEK